MANENQNPNGLPEYHDNMLIVRVSRETVSANASSFGLSFSEGSISFKKPSPGFALLERLNAEGLITRSISLGSESRREPRRDSHPRDLGMSFLSTAVTNTDTPSALDGFTVLEVRSNKEADALIKRLNDDPLVDSAERVPARYLTIDSEMEPMATPPNGGASMMWNLKKIAWSEARNHSNFREPKKIKIAVLDTGVDDNHTDLRGRIASYTSSIRRLPVTVSTQDIIGHGTHVSGTIGARLNQNIGISGICSPELHCWKIFDDDTVLHRNRNIFSYRVNPLLYINALNECLEQGIQVINLSIGGPGKPSSAEQMVFNRLINNQCVIIAAMGNDREYGSPTSYPAAIDDVIAVGATNIDDTIARFSNRGPHIALSAPGVGIWSTLPTYTGNSGYRVRFQGKTPVEGQEIPRETNYASWDGTSMAAPHVTAAAALLLASKGKMRLADVRKALTNTADKVPDMNGSSHHQDFGYGRLNLLRLLS